MWVEVATRRSGVAASVEKMFEKFVRMRGAVSAWGAKVHHRGNKRDIWVLNKLYGAPS